VTDRLPTALLQSVLARYKLCPRQDLGLAQQVGDYADPRRQQTYVHMYTAKHMGLWAALRSAVNWEDRKTSSLYSFGAGPNLCLMGWYWRPTAWEGPVVAVDPLPWSRVLDDADWQAASHSLCGVINETRGFYVPGPTLPAQLAGIQPPPRIFPPDTVAEGSVVIIPFVMNHFLVSGSVSEQLAREMTNWILAVYNRGCRILLVDLHADEVDIWKVLCTALGIQFDATRKVGFSRYSKVFADLYDADDRAFRAGLRYKQFCQARALCIQPERVEFLQGDL